LKTKIRNYSGIYGNQRGAGQVSIKTFQYGQKLQSRDKDDLQVCATFVVYRNFIDWNDKVAWDWFMKFKNSIYMDGSCCFMLTVMVYIHVASL